VAGLLFSIVITTFNREDVIRRCLDSCLIQSFSDFEIVVVDDGSTDRTVAVMAEYDDPRIEVIVHESNLGISGARHTGVANAGGDWIVVVDSDWELMPDTLERLAGLIGGGLPPDIRAIRSRLLWDDGRITPAFMPAEPIGYEGRIRWVEEEGGWDAGRCIHRDVFETNPYFPERRGAMEMLWELNTAREHTTLCVEDVLGKEHSDASNSWLRSVNASELLPRLLNEAPDMLWAAEMTLREHGPALELHGPCQYLTVLRVASMQAFLLSKRRKGAQYAARALRRKPWDPMVWATLVLGLAGPRAGGVGTLAFRRLRAARA
jgi:glycosyltransferase involved in cell wall biosynthesis